MACLRLCFARAPLAAAQPGLLVDAAAAPHACAQACPAHLLAWPGRSRPHVAHALTLLCVCVCVCVCALATTSWHCPLPSRAAAPAALDSLSLVHRAQ